MKKILIVDDEEDMIWTLQKNLRNDTLDVYVNIAQTGEKALKILKEVPIDMVVTDIRMPGISGIELLSEIKRNYSHISVVLMTAFPSEEYSKIAAQYGCLDIVEKPFDIKKLRGIVRRYVGNGAGSDEFGLRNGEKTIAGPKTSAFGVSNTEEEDNYA